MTLLELYVSVKFLSLFCVCFRGKDILPLSLRLPFIPPAEPSGGMLLSVSTYLNFKVKSRFYQMEALKSMFGVFSVSVSVFYVFLCRS